MVLLTMTPAIVRAVQTARELDESTFEQLQLPSDPSLAEPEVRNPISHSQLIDIAKLLKKHAPANDEGHAVSYHLNTLLKGSRIYIPPPPPKKEPVRIPGPTFRYTMLTLDRLPNTKP